MVIPVGFSQVNVKFTGTAVPTGAEITFGVENGVGLTPAQIATLVATAITSNNLMQWMVVGCNITSILVKNGPNATGPAAELSYSIAGTQSGGSGAAAPCALIRKNTAFGGRKGSGRLFMPGQGEVVINPGGVLDPSQVAGLTSVWEDIRTDLAAGDITMYLLHADATTPYPIDNLDCQAVVATQRRRQRR